MQLYTVREALGEYSASEVAKVLDEVRGRGYRWIELFSGFLGQRPEALARMLEERELGVLAAHVPLEDLEQAERLDPSGRAALLDGYRTLGCTELVCPWLEPSRRGSVDDYRVLGQSLGQIAARLEDEGFALGYHNHDFELREVMAVGNDSDGPRESLDGLTALFRGAVGESQQARLFLEPDVYWLAWAGRDPASYLETFPAPIGLVHLKDGTLPGRGGTKPANKAQFEPLGEGDIDLSSVLDACRLRDVDRLVVEQDFCSGSVFDAVGKSLEHVERLLEEKRSEDSHPEESHPEDRHPDDRRLEQGP